LVRRKESIYSISRGILNRKMIDLAENAGAQFFFNRKYGMYRWLCILGETEREEHGKIKI
jgi:kynurenine 3-monooxygenase